MLSNYFTCILTLPVHQVLPSISESPASSLVQGPAHLKIQVCSKCIFSAISGPELFFNYYYKKNQQAFDPSIYTFSRAVFTEGSITSCGSPALAVPSQWERRQTLLLGSGLVLPLLPLGQPESLSSCAQVKGRQLSRAQWSLGVVWCPLPSLLSSSSLCWFWPYGQVRHPKTGRQLQAGKSPPVTSLLSVPLLRTVHKDLLEGLEDTSVTPVQLNCSSSSPSLWGDRWQILLVNTEVCAILIIEIQILVTFWLRGWQLETFW